MSVHKINSQSMVFEGEIIYIKTVIKSNFNMITQLLVGYIGREFETVFYCFY